MKNVIKNSMKKRKGFSLVELVVVILIIAILAVAVFAGGSAAIKKSQVSRTTSDLHNFSVAVESTMNENPSVANIKTAAEMEKIAEKLNKNLPADYQLKQITTSGKESNNTDECLKLADVTATNLVLGNGDSWLLYQSAKKDAWDNNYYVVLDFGERHATGTSDFYITVVSAGPNAQTTIGDASTESRKGIEADDIFLLTQYTDGNVTAATYNVATDQIYTILGASAEGDGTKTLVPSGAANFTVKGTAPTATATNGAVGGMYYCGGAAHAFLDLADVPVNF